MAKRIKGFNIGTLAIVLGVAIIGIYIWGQVFDTAGTFVAPDQGTAEAMVLWVLQLLLVMGLAYLGLNIASKFSSGRVGRRTMFTYLVLGVAIYFLWESVIVHTLQADTLQELMGKTAQKLGILK